MKWFAAMGWLVAAMALVAGVPLFVRMPPWCDLTLYDIAARNILQGGVHYRDVFDTNPPGFVLTLAGIRTLFGNSVEAVRILDLLIVASSVLVLMKWAKPAGGNSVAIAWMAAGAAVFYPFTSEFNHCQRDVWMLLPVVIVGYWRAARREHFAGTAPLPYRPLRFSAAFYQGLILGFAAWLKPHCLIPAAAVWLVTRDREQPLMKDLLGNLFGGFTAIILGCAWLLHTGAWPYFLEVFEFWNPGYLRMVLGELSTRLNDELFIFPPWSLFHAPAVVLAAVALFGRNRCRAALAALYLAWLLQALIVQRGFEYVHVPETFLMLALFAAYRVPVGFLGIAIILVCEPHPLFNLNRMNQWPGCWESNLPEVRYFERRNAVAFKTKHFAGIDWVQLHEVAESLKTQDVKDRELIAWHDSPHALYLLLNVKPGFRFMHVSTVTGIGPEQYEQLRKELHAAAPAARFVVVDLERVYNSAIQDYSQPGLLPPPFAQQFTNLRKQFPFDQTPVFRSNHQTGRYIVFRLDQPLTHHCRIPPGLGSDLASD